MASVQDSFPLAVIKSLDRCKAAFTRKSSAAIEREIEDFYLYHDEVLIFQGQQRQFERRIMQVESNRKAFVAEEMARYDIAVRMREEHIQWCWSPLFMDLIRAPPPTCISRPFEHSDEEFQGLLKWMEPEGKRVGDRNDPPHMAYAMNLFARSWVGGRVPMLCPVLGLTEEIQMAHADQIMLAMEEVIRVGKVFFPDMDIKGESFATFRVVLDTGENHGGLGESFCAWRRDVFIRACLDIVALGKEDLLRDMWVTRPGVDEQSVADAFRNILLYRENIDLGYIFGAVEATGVWPAAGVGLFVAAKDLLEDSLHHLHGKLQKWNVSEDLVDLDTLRASQVLCTIDQIRVFQGRESDPYSLGPGGWEPSSLDGERMGSC